MSVPLSLAYHLCLTLFKNCLGGETQKKPVEQKIHRFYAQYTHGFRDILNNQRGSLGNPQSRVAIVAVPFVIRIRGFTVKNLQKKVTLCLLTVCEQSGICFKNEDRTKPRSVTNRTLKARPHVPAESDLKCGFGGQWACKIHCTKHVVHCFHYREKTRYDHFGDTSLQEKRAVGRYIFV